MNTDEKLAPAFVAQQRKRLEQLLDQFLHEASVTRAEDRELSQLLGSEVQDSGDDGATATWRNNAIAFNTQGSFRLGEILRALDKIEEGSYGLSDNSGEPIPRARLETVPEACLTVEEQARHERMAYIYPNAGARLKHFD